MSHELKAKIDAILEANWPAAKICEYFEAEKRADKTRMELLYRFGESMGVSKFKKCEWREKQ